MAQQLGETIRRDTSHAQVQVLHLALCTQQVFVHAKHRVIDAGLSQSQDDNASGQDNGQDPIMQDLCAQIQTGPQRLIVYQATEASVNQGTSQEGFLR